MRSRCAIHISSKTVAKIMVGHQCGVRLNNALLVTIVFGALGFASHVARSRPDLESVLPFQQRSALRFLILF